METDFSNPKCVLSDSDDVIDDCYIRIDFGYGSKRDLERYTFGPITDELGEEILQFIASKTNKPLDEFKTDITFTEVL